MPELSNEDILNSIDFPHNKWRRTNDEGHLVGKNNVLVHIGRLRKLQMPIDEIKTLIGDLYYDAMAEMQAQIKEKCGKTPREFYEDKLKAEVANEGGVPQTPLQAS